MNKRAFTYKPTAKQKIFHKTKSLHKLFGGAAGGGKTQALLAECIMNCIRYPGIKGLFLRRTYSEVMETIEDRLPSMIKAVNGEKPYYIRNNVLHFNGCQIVLGYWQDDRSNDRYFGTEYDFIAVDELTRTIYKKTDLQKLLARNRTSKARLRARGFVPYFMAGTNPGGLGHMYVKDVWIDGNPWTGYKKADFAFISSRVEDNPYLLDNDPNYVRRLESMADENMRKALRWGDRNVFEGQFFLEYMELQHVVPMVRIARAVRTILCLDYGIRKPAAVYLLRRDTEGQFWASHELYVTGHTFEQLGIAIKKKYASFNPDYIEADPAVFSKNGSENSGAEILQEHSGFRVLAANNNRQAGRNLVKSLLKSNRLFIQTTCVNLKREFGEVVYDDKTDNDLDSNGSDHALDALRYGLMDIAGDATNAITKELKKMNESMEKPKKATNLISD